MFFAFREKYGPELSTKEADNIIYSMRREKYMTFDEKGEPITCNFKGDHTTLTATRNIKEKVQKCSIYQNLQTGYFQEEEMKNIFGPEVELDAGCKYNLISVFYVNTKELLKAAKTPELLM
eukprot:Pgem_evm1s13753